MQTAQAAPTSADTTPRDQVAGDKKTFSVIRSLPHRTMQGPVTCGSWRQLAQGNPGLEKTCTLVRAGLNLEQ